MTFLSSFGPPSAVVRRRSLRSDIVQSFLVKAAAASSPGTLSSHLSHRRRRSQCLRRHAKRRRCTICKHTNATTTTTSPLYALHHDHGAACCQISAPWHDHERRFVVRRHRRRRFRCNMQLCSCGRLYHITKTSVHPNICIHQRNTKSEAEPHYTHMRHATTHTSTTGRCASIRIERCCGAASCRRRGAVALCFVAACMNDLQVQHAASTFARCCAQYDIAHVRDMHWAVADSVRRQNTAADMLSAHTRTLPHILFRSKFDMLLQSRPTMMRGTAALRKMRMCVRFQFHISTSRRECIAFSLCTHDSAIIMPCCGDTMSTPQRHDDDDNMRLIVTDTISTSKLPRRPFNDVCVCSVLSITIKVATAARK